MNISIPTIELYQNYATRFEKSGFIDFWIQGGLTGDDGNGYFVTFMIGRGVRFNDRDYCRLTISKEPLWYFTTPSSKIIQKGESPEIDLRFYPPRGTMTTGASSTAFTAKYEDMEFIFSPPDSYRTIYRGKDASVDLTFKALGPPFWFNEGKEEGARISPSNLIWGFESFGNMTGSITLGGKEVKLKGAGIHECTVTEHAAWPEFVWMDWLWFVFDELYGLIFEIQGGQYKEGLVYLMKEKEYLPLRGFDIDRPQWAYSPKLQHHWPISWKANAQTDKGILSLDADLVRLQPVIEIDKYKPAVSMPSADMELKCKGTFTCQDGRTITLNNGKAGNEVFATYNFAQSHF